MLQLRVFGTSRQLANVAQALEQIPGARHVVRTGDGSDDSAFVTADLFDHAVDEALEHVRRMGIQPDDVTLVRVETIGTDAAQRPLATVVWTDLVSQAGINARPVARYLLFMAIAGVIAAFGVIYENVTLVVGAMAISPDTLPVTAAATALVLARWPLAARAVAALIIGLAVACIVGATLTAVLNLCDLLPTGFDVANGNFLQGLSSVNISTPIVAFAAGIASILALETRASSAVGVAISVTTIPASAYLGVAAGVGEASKAEGALLVLGVNIAMLLVGGCLTLIVQRRLASRSPRSSEADAADRVGVRTIDGAGP